MGMTSRVFAFGGYRNPIMTGGGARPVPGCAAFAALAATRGRRARVARGKRQPPMHQLRPTPLASFLLDFTVSPHSGGKAGHRHMAPVRVERQTAQAGFSLAELLVVIAVIGILAGMTVPFFISYYQSAALKAAAEELVTFLNQGRQIAIKENQSVCVQTTSGAIQMRVGGCSGTLWVGPGTDASGNWKVPQGFTLGSTATAVFSYLGAASPAATYTVTNSANGKTLSVTLSASGRVTVGP